MNIPILNLYYLLSYAWDKLDEGGLVSAGLLDCRSAVDLFAKLLSSGMSYIIQRGLDRGYIAHHEQTPRVRGRIDFDTTLRTTFFRDPLLFCEYDEFGNDVLHNQIVRYTIEKLLLTPELDETIREELRIIDRRLRQISLIRLEKKHFSLVQLHSNNYYYDFLLKVCELIYDNSLPTEEDGPITFRDFLRDDKAMRGLFEAFVRNFFKREQAEFKVKSDRFYWQARGSGNTIKMIPELRTDVCLASPERTIIIDTKYTDKIFQFYRDTKKIRSEHLFQIHAYLTNWENKEGLHSKCEGIVLYPTVEEEVNLQFEVHGHKISIRTINLNQEWRDIHKGLLKMIS